MSGALGAAFGAATSLFNWLSVPADAGGGVLADTILEPACRVVSLVLDSGWAWAGLAVAAGWLARAPLRAVVAGTVSLLAATAAYPVVAHLLQGHGAGSFGEDLGSWGPVALLAGPLLGLAGATSRRGGATGLVASLTVPAGAVVQMVVMPPGWGGAVVRAEASWARALVVTVATLTACLLVVRSAGPRARPSESA